MANKPTAGPVGSNKHAPPQKPPQPSKPTKPTAPQQQQSKPPQTKSIMNDSSASDDDSEGEIILSDNGSEDSEDYDSPYSKTQQKALKDSCCKDPSSHKDHEEGPGHGREIASAMYNGGAKKLKKGPFCEALMTHNPERAFEALIYPLEVDDFMSTYYQQQEIALEREMPKYFDGIFELGKVLDEVMTVGEEHLDYQELVEGWNATKMELTTAKKMLGETEEDYYETQKAIAVVEGQIQKEIKSMGDDEEFPFGDKGTKKKGKTAPTKPVVKRQPSKALLAELNRLQKHATELEELITRYDAETKTLMATRRKDVARKDEIETPQLFYFGKDFDVSTFDGEYGEINLNPHINPHFDGAIYPAIKARLRLLDTALRSMSDGAQHDDEPECDIPDCAEKCCQPQFKHISDEDLEAAAREALENATMEDDEDGGDVQHDGNLQDNDDLAILGLTPTSDQPNPDELAMFKGKTIEQLHGMIGEMMKQKTNAKKIVKIEVLMNYLRAGCNVMINHPQHFCERIWRLVWLLESHFRTLVDSFVQVVPKGSMGTPKRYGSEDCFILQLSGETNFFLYDMNLDQNEFSLDGLNALIAEDNNDGFNSYVGPFIQHGSIETGTRQLPKSSHSLKQGDFLYLPAHSVHQVVPTLEPPAVYEQDVIDYNNGQVDGKNNGNSKNKGKIDSETGLIVNNSQSSPQPDPTSSFFPPVQERESVYLIISFPQQAKYKKLFKNAFQSAFDECLSQQPLFLQNLPLHFQTFLGSMHDEDISTDLDIVPMGIDMGDGIDDIEFDGGDDGEDFGKEEEEDTKPSKPVSKKKTQPRSGKQSIKLDTDEYNYADLSDDFADDAAYFGRKKLGKGNAKSTPAMVSKKQLVEDSEGDSGSDSGFDQDAADFMDSDNDLGMDLNNEIPPFVLSDNASHLHRKWLAMGSINPEYRTFLKKFRQTQISDLVTQINHNITTRLLSHIHLAADQLNLEFIKGRLPPPREVDMDGGDDDDDDEDTHEEDGEDTDGEDISLEELEAMEAMNPTDDSDEDDEDAEGSEDDNNTKSRSKYSTMTESDQDEDGDEDNDEDNDEDDEYDRDKACVLATTRGGKIIASRSTLLASTLGVLNRRELELQFPDNVEHINNMMENILTQLNGESGIRLAFPDNLAICVEPTQADDDEEDEDDELLQMENDEDDEDNEEDEDEDFEDVLAYKNSITKRSQQLLSPAPEADEQFPGEELFPALCGCGEMCDAFQLYCSQISRSVSLPHAPKCIAFYNSLHNDRLKHMVDPNSDAGLFKSAISGLFDSEDDLEDEDEDVDDEDDEEEDEDTDDEDIPAPIQRPSFSKFAKLGSYQGLHKQGGCCNKDSKKQVGGCPKDPQKHGSCCDKDPKKQVGCCHKESKKHGGCCEKDPKKRVGCCNGPKKQISSTTMQSSDDDDDDDHSDSEGHDHAQHEDEDDERSDSRTELPVALLPLVRMLQEEYPRLININDVQLDWKAVRTTSSGFMTQLPLELIHTINDYNPKTPLQLLSAADDDDDDEEDDEEDGDDADLDDEPSERFAMLYKLWAVCELFVLGFVEIAISETEDINTTLADEGPDGEFDDEDDEDDLMDAGSQGSSQGYMDFYKKGQEMEKMQKNAAKKTLAGLKKRTQMEISDDEDDDGEEINSDDNFDGEGEEGDNDYLAGLLAGFEGEEGDFFEYNDEDDQDEDDFDSDVDTSDDESMSVEEKAFSDRLKAQLRQSALQKVSHMNQTQPKTASKPNPTKPVSQQPTKAASGPTLGHAVTESRASAQQRAKEMRKNQYGSSDDDDDGDDDSDSDNDFADLSADSDFDPSTSTPFDLFDGEGFEGEGELDAEALMRLYGGYDGEGENDMLSLLDLEDGDQMNLGDFDFGGNDAGYNASAPKDVSQGKSTKSVATTSKAVQADSDQSDDFFDEDDDDEDGYDEDDDLFDADGFQYRDGCRIWGLEEDEDDDLDALMDGEEDDDEQAYWDQLLANDDDFSEDESDMGDIWASDEEVQLPPPPQVKKNGKSVVLNKSGFQVEVIDDKKSTKPTQNKNSSLVGLSKAPNTNKRSRQTAMSDASDDDDEVVVAHVAKKSNTKTSTPLQSTPASSLTAAPTSAIKSKPVQPTPAAITPSKTAQVTTTKSTPPAKSTTATRQAPITKPTTAATPKSTKGQGKK